METCVENYYLCVICERAFKNNRSLSKHMEVHTDKKPDKKLHTFVEYAGPYTCDVCSKSFISKCVFDMHIKKHKDEIPLSCDICKTTFHSKGQLSRHKKIHTGEQPFSCDICRKSFGQESNLNVHRLLHTVERPYSCNLCDKSYQTSSDLSRHYNSKEHAAETMETIMPSQPPLPTSIIYCEGTDVKVEIKEEEIYEEDPLSIKIKR